MAQFSQGFLSSLGRPEMSQSLFGLGAAIGGVPGQMKQRQKEQAFNQLMQQVQAAQGSGDFASMKALSQQMAQTNPQQAAQIMQAAIAGEEKQKRIQAGSGMFSGTPEEARASAEKSAALGDFASAQQALTRAEKLEQQGKQVGRARTSAQMLMSEIQGIMKTPDISEANKEKALGLLREAAVAGEDSDLLKPRVDELKQSLLPVKTGSRAAPTFKEIMRPNPQTGQEEKRLIRFDTDPITGANIETDVGRAPPKEVASKEKKKGDIARSARKPWEEMFNASSTASVSLMRNKRLSTEIAAEPDKSTGFISRVRTEILDIAGMRDKEETLKTDFLRGVNTEIIGSLPPGVASDTDIAIFSQGFPDDSRSTTQILDYLEVERKFLGALQDKALLAEQFLGKQMKEGQDGNLVGFSSYERGYSTAFNSMRTNIKEDVAKGMDAVQAQERHMASFKEVFGFTPAYYL